MFNSYVSLLEGNRFEHKSLHAWYPCWFGRQKLSVLKFLGSAVPIAMQGTREVFHLTCPDWQGLDGLASDEMMWHMNYCSLFNALDLLLDWKIWKCWDVWDLLSASVCFNQQTIGWNQAYLDLLSGKLTWLWKIMVLMGKSTPSMALAMESHCF